MIPNVITSHPTAGWESRADCPMAGPHDGVAVGDFSTAKAGPSRLKIAVIIIADVVTVVVVTAANGVPRNEGEGTTRRRVVSRSSR
jgi:hypothetical protein